MRAVTKYRVRQNLWGMRLTDFYLPDGKELPSSWEAMPLHEQEEWLYTHAKYTNTLVEDIFTSETADIIEVTDWMADV